MNSLISCITITYAEISHINSSITVNYQLNQSVFCSFFSINTEFLNLIDVSRNASTASEQREVINAENNTITFQVANLDFVQIGYIVFTDQTLTSHSFLLPALTSKNQFQGQIQLVNLIAISSKKYQIAFEFSLLNFQFFQKFKFSLSKIVVEGFEFLSFGSFFDCEATPAFPAETTAVSCSGKSGKLFEAANAVNVLNVRGTVNVVFEVKNGSFSVNVTDTAFCEQFSSNLYRNVTVYFSLNQAIIKSEQVGFQVAGKEFELVFNFFASSSEASYFTSNKVISDDQQQVGDVQFYSLCVYMGDSSQIRFCYENYESLMDQVKQKVPVDIHAYLIYNNMLTKRLEIVNYYYLNYGIYQLDIQKDKLLVLFCLRDNNNQQFTFNMTVNALQTTRLNFGFVFTFVAEPGCNYYEIPEKSFYIFQDYIKMYKVFNYSLFVKQLIDNKILSFNDQVYQTKEIYFFIQKENLRIMLNNIFLDVFYFNSLWINIILLIVAQVSTVSVYFYFSSR